MSNDEPDFEISEASISGAHRRDDIFGSQAQSRRHIAQISVLVVVALFASFFVFRAPLRAFIDARQGTPTLAPAQLSQVVVQTNVSAGTLTVNGKPVPFTLNSPDQTVTLPKQHSVITLTAPPFLPLTCTSDGGRFVSQTDGRCGSNGTDNNIPILDMNFTLNDMPPLARQQFATYFTQKLAQLNALQTPVPTKEHYATGTDVRSIPTVALAQAPLQAQVLATPSNTNPGFFQSAECSDTVCPGSGFMVPDVAASLSFSFALQLSVGWRFLSGAGRQVATYLPPANIASYGSAPFYIQVQYDATNGWSDLNDSSVNPAGPFGETNPVSELADNLCQTGASLVSYLLQQQGIGSGGGESNNGKNTLSGCLLAIINSNNQQSPPDLNVDPTKDTVNAWFLVHFGAVLAVNAKAHALLPQLPQANAQEVTEIHNATQ